MGDSTDADCKGCESFSGPAANCDYCQIHFTHEAPDELNSGKRGATHTHRDAETRSHMKSGHATTNLLGYSLHTYGWTRRSSPVVNNRDEYTEKSNI